MLVLMVVAFLISMVVVMTMIVLMEDEQAENVEGEANGANDQDKLWVGNFLRLEESLNSIKEDGKAKRDEEYTVDKTSE